MEEKNIALNTEFANRLSSLVFNHSLPIHIDIGAPIEHLRSIKLSYNFRDELLVEWLIARVTEEV
jgi:hypothetical protein